jgi:hypothetical protein
VIASPPPVLLYTFVSGDAEQEGGTHNAFYGREDGWGEASRRRGARAPARLFGQRFSAPQIHPKRQTPSIASARRVAFFSTYFLLFVYGAMKRDQRSKKRGKTRRRFSARRGRPPFDGGSMSPLFCITNRKETQQTQIHDEVVLKEVRREAGDEAAESMVRGKKRALVVVVVVFPSRVGASCVFFLCFVRSVPRRNCSLWCSEN